MRARGVAIGAGLLAILAVAVWLASGGSDATGREAQVLQASMPGSRSAGVDLPEIAAAPRGEAPAAPAASATPIAPHLPCLVVRRSDGSPLEGADLRLTEADEPLSEPGVTDADGRFDLPVEAAPEHAWLSIVWSRTIRVLEEGHEAEAPIGSPVSADVELRRADFTSGVPRRIELDTGWMIGGTVTDGRGKPVHAARLVVDDLCSAAESDREGAFLLRDIPADRAGVTLVARAPGREMRTLEVAAPPPEQDRAVALVELPECASLRGVVVHDSGAPLDDVEVCLVGADQIAPGGWVARTGPDGAFAFTGVAEGRFDLLARVDDEHAQRNGTLDAAAETWAHDVLLSCGANRDVRLVVANGLPQRGRVVDDRGRPLAHHLVVARVLRDTPCHPTFWSPAASAETDSSGAFALRRLAPGAWELTVEGNPAGCTHGDGFLWRPLATRGAQGALAQEGPPPGPPRPVEARREAEVAHVAADVEIVVQPPGGSPEWSLQGWPPLTARLSIALGSPVRSGGRIDVYDGIASHALASTTEDAWMLDLRLPITAESAAGLVCFSAPACLPRIMVLHDAQLEHEFNEVVLDQAPRLEVRVAGERGDERPDDVELVAHWRGGGRAEWVGFDEGPYGTLLADRRAGNFELTVSAPGYRRWRQSGIVPASREPLRIQVGLRRW